MAPATEPVSTPSGSLPINIPSPSPMSGSHERIRPVARGAASALCRPRSASIRSSACSAARSRLVARGAPAFSLMHRLRDRSRMRSRLWGCRRCSPSSRACLQAKCGDNPQAAVVSRARLYSSGHESDCTASFRLIPDCRLRARERNTSGQTRISSASAAPERWSSQRSRRFSTGVRAALIPSPYPGFRCFRRAGRGLPLERVPS